MCHHHTHSRKKSAQKNSTIYFHQVGHGLKREGVGRREPTAREGQRPFKNDGCRMRDSGTSSGRMTFYDRFHCDAIPIKTHKILRNHIWLTLVHDTGCRLVVGKGSSFGVYFWGDPWDINPSWPWFSDLVGAIEMIETGKSDTSAGLIIELYGNDARILFM